MPSIFTHNGVFTVKSTATSEHRTFRIKTQHSDAKFAPNRRIVALLSGPDNTNDFKGFGFVNESSIQVWRRCETQGFLKLAKMLENLDAHEAAGHVSVHASTRCRICNRRLTTPESILSGIGPICEGRS